MSKEIVNKYVPGFVQHFELPWYERDGLMSYIDALKCDEFSNDSDAHFKNAQVVNFHIVHHECRGDPLKGNCKDYKTIEKEDLNHYSSNSKKIIAKMFL